MHTVAGWGRALILIAVASSAFAQDDLSPPRLVEGVEPRYPEERRGSGASAVVVVTLTIDAAGTVTDAAVAQSGGEDFDAAALEAARRLRFDPARRAGQPIAARIPFRFEFTAPASGVLSGRVLSPDERPIAGATVRVGQEPPIAVDEEGAFEIELPPGSYAVAIAAPGHEPAASQEVVAAGEATAVAYRLRAIPRAAPPAAVQDIEVRGERPAREVTRRPLEQREITRIAGTNGDAIRAIENMPGVARPPFILGALIIRGSAPADTDIFVDGTAIPIAYHFGGLSSVIPSELLSRIDFFPGNFGPEYGRALGGVVDIGLRSPRRDRIHAMAQVDLIDARLVLEAPLGPTTRFLVAARRSYVDAWITPILSSTSTGVVTAPAYYDYQAMIEQDIGSSTTARLSLFGSDDRLALALNSTGGDPTLSGDLDSHIRFFRAQLRIDTKLSETARWINMLSWGPDHTEFSAGSLDLDILTRILQLRSDLRVRLWRGVTAVVGADLVRATADVTVYAPPIPEDGQNNGPGFARPRRLQRLSDIVLYRLGGYAMLELEPVPGLKLLPSVRIDNSDEIGDTRVAPRLAVRWEVGDGTVLKAGAGLYFQPPEPYQAFRPFGTPDLRHNQAQHYGAGIEQQLTRQVNLSLEGFYKKLDHLVDQRPDATGSESGVTYVNSGSGRVYGMELLLRYKADARFFGWVAYTLSRSERRADDSEEFRRFDFDQTHILTAVGSVKLGRGWELGARFRYVTGSPFTPPVGAIYDADAGAYSPINGTPFSERSAAFHQLDLRVDKTWDFRAWKLSLYLDVQNVYSRRNPEGRQYNYNYSQSDVISGLPIIPVFGIRGEL